MFCARVSFRIFGKTSGAAAVLKLFLCLAPLQLPANVIYSNITSAFPGQSIHTQYLINNGYAGTTFNAAGTGNLASIVIALSQATGSAPITAGLYTDVYSRPAALLESWTIPVIPTCCGSVPAAVPPLTTLVSVAHPLLSVGSTYWFVLNLGNKNTVYWWYNDEAINGGLWTHTALDPLYPANAKLAAPGIQLNSLQAPPPVRSGVLSHIAAGGGWSTVITLVNSSTAAIPLTVALHANDGSALSLPITTMQLGLSQTTTAASVSATLDPFTTIVLSMGDQVASTVAGWADVLTTGTIGGFAIFRYTPSTGSPQEGTVPLQSQFPSTITLPYDNTAGFATGVALSNLSTSSTGVMATIWDASGNLLGKETIDMVGNGHASFSLPDQLSDSAGKQGIVTFQSTAVGGIAGLGLRFSPFGTFTSVPIMLGQ